MKNETKIALIGGGAIIIAAIIAAIADDIDLTKLIPSKESNQSENTDDPSKIQKSDVQSKCIKGFCFDFKESCKITQSSTVLNSNTFDCVLMVTNTMPQDEHLKFYKHNNYAIIYDSSGQINNPTSLNLGSINSSEATLPSKIPVRFSIEFELPLNTQPNIIRLIAYSNVGNFYIYCFPKSFECNNELPITQKK